MSIVEMSQASTKLGRADPPSQISSGKVAPSAGEVDVSPFRSQGFAGLNGDIFLAPCALFKYNCIFFGIWL